LGAEIENMHKRFIREASDIRKYSNEDLLRKIVPVLDTLSLALSAADKAKAQSDNEALLSNKLFQSFIQGVEMTAKQFEQVLESCGVEFIESKGKAFDPMLHEALGQAKSEGVEDNVIIEEFQRGFKLAGRIIRHAKVIVNKN
jgi:molecular chaperone GrpE